MRSLGFPQLGQLSSGAGSGAGAAAFCAAQNFSSKRVISCGEAPRYPASASAFSASLTAVSFSGEMPDGGAASGGSCFGISKIVNIFFSPFTKNVCFSMQCIDRKVCRRV